MRVLSLFDGMACGRIALDRLNINVQSYFASEIEPSSIKIALKNYPDINHLGNVKELDDEKLDSLGTIDLLIGGSPCRNLSKLIHGNKNTEKGIVGDSFLFYEYERIFKYIKPKYFLFENVEMDDGDRDIITNLLGVEPVMIDSALFSAQDRKRYYWTNIELGELPKSNNLVIKDIMEDSVDEKYYYKQSHEIIDLNKKVCATLDVKGHDILKRVHNVNFKCATLTACRGGYKQKKILIDDKVRRLTPLEYERLQTVPDNYTYGVADGHRYNMLGDGWTVEVVKFLLKGLTKAKDNGIISNEVTNMDEIIIYTDGGCRGNAKDENIGGWGAVLSYKGHIKELWDGERNTTNNIQELKGAINALKALKTSHIPVKLHCDSAYVVNGITSWVKGWKKKGWKKSDGKVVENLELWKELDQLVLLQDDVTFVKVKGHSGLAFNELADELANRAMDGVEADDN